LKAAIYQEKAISIDGKTIALISAIASTSIQQEA
jgi:hypothetical protein